MSDHSYSGKDRPEYKTGVGRRDFMRVSALLGAAVPAGQVLLSSKALARQAVQAAPATSSNSPLTVRDVYAKAREALFPICRVCPQCDGVACAGENPGIGGIGSGMSFQNNFRDLQQIRLKVRTIHDPQKPDTSTTFLGHKLSFPAMAAPINGSRTTFQGRISDEQYFAAIIGGCVDAGTVGAVGDTESDPFEWVKARYDVIAKFGGRAIAGIKPRPNENYIRVIRLAEESGACMITIDVDSAGRYGRSDAGITVGPKNVAQLRELIRSTKIPFIVKGIATPDQALMAGEAGAAAIAVSNHGGRICDHTPGTAESLQAVADQVKGKLPILVDGCVHYGNDVLRYLALGADAVLVGRHIVRAAFGAGREGVALFMQTMRQEFEAAMVLTGVSTVSQIDRKVLV